MKNIFIILITFFLVISCEEIINEEDISTATVHLTAPADTTTLQSNTVSFSWQAITGATEYQLQIAKPNFDNAVTIVLDTTISQLSFTKELTNTSYQWRVKAQNTAYETNYTTQSFSITTADDFSANIIILQNPEEALITNEANQLLNWNTITGALDYRIQIWQPDTNGTLVLDEITANNQFNSTFTDGNFTWQVRAQNNAANTAYSSRTILVDLTNPNTPTLLTPTDNQTLTDTVVNFTWQRNALAGSTETDKIYIYSDVNLTNLIHENTVTNNSYDYTLTTGNTYYWNMKSFDEAGNESVVSNTFSFTIN